jgi:hypothetical protein
MTKAEGIVNRPRAPFRNTRYMHYQIPTPPSFQNLPPPPSKIMTIDLSNFYPTHHRREKQHKSSKLIVYEHNGYRVNWIHAITIVQVH